MQEDLRSTYDAEKKLDIVLRELSNLKQEVIDNELNTSVRKAINITWDSDECSFVIVDTLYNLVSDLYIKYFRKVSNLEFYPHIISNWALVFSTENDLDIFLRQIYEDPIYEKVKGYNVSIDVMIDNWVLHYQVPILNDHDKIKVFSDNKNNQDQVIDRLAYTLFWDTWTFEIILWKEKRIIDRDYILENIDKIVRRLALFVWLAKIMDSLLEEKQTRESLHTILSNLTKQDIEKAASSVTLNEIKKIIYSEWTEKTMKSEVHGTKYKIWTNHYLWSAILWNMWWIEELYFAYKDINIYNRDVRLAFDQLFKFNVKKLNELFK